MTLSSRSRSDVKWEMDDYNYRGHISSVMKDSLFDFYHDIPSVKELWEKLKAR
ncbi:hypothetical protein Scep_019257 [Stephania cephalantha]|uniref:Uncharacterized protein n=1 Tax=Stephania cephalantha TaxID=152367 RepID=A0AAP0IAV8_9MAGN